MKINYDCIREMLRYFELELIFDAQKGYNYLSFNQICNALPNFSINDIAYSIKILCEVSYIKTNLKDINSMNTRLTSVLVYTLTFEGHQFLENIKSETVWDKTKKISKSVGSSSLEIISSIATSVLTSLISQKLGLPL